MPMMSINEEQLSYLLKQFLAQYDGNFDHVEFEAVPGQNGYIVHFCKTPPARPEEHYEDPATPAENILNPLNPLSPISIFHDFGGFGGFGGGSSGGGGASGTW